MAKTEAKSDSVSVAISNNDVQALANNDLQALMTVVPLPEDLVAVSGGWEGPMWMPHWSELADKRIAEEQKKCPQGVHQPLFLAGKLTAPMGWGRPVFAIDVPGYGQIKMPEHTTLYGALNGVQLEKQVYVTYKGISTKPGKPGQNAPFVYDVRCAKSDIHPKGRDRADAIKMKEKDEGDTSFDTAKLEAAAAT